MFFYFLSIVTGLIALAKPDLAGNKEFYDGIHETRYGYNSYTFWDYYIVHVMNMLLPWIILILYRPKLTLKTVYLSILFVICYALFIFVLISIITNSLDPNNKIHRRWIPNWLYLNTDEFNPFVHKLAQPLTNYPAHLFSYSFFLSFFVWFCSIMYYYSDRIYERFFKDYKSQMRWDFFERVKTRYLQTTTNIKNLFSSKK